MASQVENYRFRPLDPEQDEIRILLLEPGQDGTTLRGRLDHIKLSATEHISYESISYCWGELDLVAEIELNDGTLYMPISASLALKRFRHPFERRSLWIDSVCINQTDNVERGQQVALMYNVYSEASANLIHLGEDDGNALAAAQAVTTLDRQIRVETDDYRSFHDMVRSYAGIVAQSPLATFSIQFDVKAILVLLSRPWFQRLWVIQEAALARSNTCFYGDQEIPLREILRVAVWLGYKWSAVRQIEEKAEYPWRHQVLFDTSDEMLGWFCTRPEERLMGLNPASSIASLLLTLRDFQASEPRDYVYGMLGLHRHLFPEEPTMLLEPDYGRPVANIFADATVLSIKDKKSLDAWRYLTYGEGQPHLPSWVVRWNANDDTLGPMTTLHAPQFQPDNDMPAQLRSAPDLPWHMIGIKGFVSDRISKCSKTCDQYKDLVSFLTDPSSSWLDPEKHNIVNRGFSVSRTLLADNVDGRRATIHDQAWVEAVADYLRTNHCLKDLFPSGGACTNGCNNHIPSRDRMINLRRYARMYQDMCWNRCLFTTNDGRIGVGPRNLEQGDTIVILYGGSTAYVLRPHADNRAHWRLLGECYVDGIMYGEATNEHLRQGATDEEFILR